MKFKLAKVGDLFKVTFSTNDEEEIRMNLKGDFEISSSGDAVKIDAQEVDVVTRKAIRINGDLSTRGK